MSRALSPAVFAGARLPLLFAHRGYSARAPENTLAAFSEAKEAGIPGVELDVHRCATGELVVIHDHDTKRLSGKSLVVEEASLETLKDLDVGSQFDTRFSGERIPLLSEVIDLLGVSLYYDIEIKSRRKDRPAALAEDLAGLLRARGLVGHCIVSSFDPRAIAAFKRTAPEVPTAIIYSRDSGVPFGLRHGQGRFLSRCEILKPANTDLTALSRFIDQRLFGYPVITWTVDDPVRARECLRLGVTGLVSNDPEPIAQAVSR